MVSAASLAGCAWDTPRAGPVQAEVPRAPAGETSAAESGSVALGAARTAHSMVGVPYLWGGATPAGFDCSGLVHYAYRMEGVAVPRTASDLYDASRPVPLDLLRPGDLVFFDTAAKGGHVGIVLDQERFVHAPSSGKQVTVGRLSQSWYRQRLIRAGRLELPAGGLVGAGTPGP